MLISGEKLQCLFLFYDMPYVLFDMDFVFLGFFDMTFYILSSFYSIEWSKALLEWTNILIYFK